MCNWLGLCSSSSNRSRSSSKSKSCSISRVVLARSSSSTAIWRRPAVVGSVSTAAAGQGSADPSGAEADQPDRNKLVGY